MSRSDPRCIEPRTGTARLQRAAALGELTAALAHELNNVHMVATGNLELLLGGDQRPDGRALRKCRDAVWRGAEILRALLALAVVDEGAPRPGFNAILAEVRSLLSTRLDKQGIELVVETDADASLAIDAVVLGLGLYGLLARLADTSGCRRIDLSTRCEDGQLLCAIAAELPGERHGDLLAGGEAGAQRLGTVDTQETRRLLMAAGGSLELEALGSRATVVLRLPLA